MELHDLSDGAPRLVSSSPPSAAYMRQWTELALVQVMACRLFACSGARQVSQYDSL